MTGGGRAEAAYLAAHRAHDAGALIAAWRRLARRTGACCWTWHRHDGHPLLAVEWAGGADGESFYLSAGIHGDEPAGVWGLLEWAEAHLGKQSGKLLILPCLNPWGLVANARADASGRDLNRGFTAPWGAYHRAWRELMGGRSFSQAICLHEDYDARGIYAYELYCRSGPTMAAVGLAAAAKVIPPDPRGTIDGRRARGGLLRRASLPELADGAPEAFPLYTHHADLSLTFESPSEFSLHQRVRAQVAFLEAVLQ